ncbi:oligosaccharide flippase family protein, partial [Vibrio parahaemolyticus]|uniref:oligosaccharide flippase family protein n=4 Tax=Vibrionaceae TaxID=641 RepID=UPI0011243706
MLNLIKNSKLGDRLGKLLRSSLWNATANFLVKINFLVLTFFCSQVFAIDDFGRFAIVLSTLMSFQIFASMGLATAAAKFSALYRDTDRVVPMLSSVTLLLLFFSCVSALFLYFLGEYISKEILKDESLKVYLEISSVTLLFAALKSLFTGLLQGIGEYRTISSSNLKSVLITIPVFFILAYFFGLIGAVIGLLFIELTFALSLLIKSINRQCFYFRFFLIKKINICEVLKFTLPISLSGMLIMPVNWYLLKEVAVNYSYLEVGAINVLNQWQA